MTTILEQRTALAAAVSTVEWAPGELVRCKPHPVPGNLRPGDGFVTVGRATYGETYRDYRVPLSAFVILGSDEPKADAKLDELVFPLLGCITDLYAADVSVEAQQIVTKGNGVLFALALSATFDLSN